MSKIHKTACSDLKTNSKQSENGQRLLYATFAGIFIKIAKIFSKSFDENYVKLFKPEFLQAKAKEKSKVKGYFVETQESEKCK